MKRVYYFFKDIFIPIGSIFAMIYCGSQASNINLNLVQSQEAISEYDASEISNNLSDTYNDVISYFKTDEFIEDEWFHRRIKTSNILDNVFEHGYSALKSEFDIIESSSFKDFKNKEYENSFYKHNDVEIYSDSIKILDPKIVKMDGDKEIVLKELPSRIYKVKKIQSLNNKEYNLIIFDTQEALT